MCYHNFDIGLATKYGIDQAIVLSYIWENIKRNIANDCYFHEEQHWSKDNRKALLQLFPYYTETKIEAIFSKLSENDLITYKNSSKNSQEIWYTLTKQALDYFTKGTQPAKKVRNKKTTSSEKFAEIKDFEVYTKSEDAVYFKIAYKFWKLWRDENPKSFTLQKSEVDKWTNAVKMMIEKDKHEIIRLIGVYVYFSKCAKNEAGFERFWFETLSSVSALRKKNKEDVYYLDQIIVKVNSKIQQSDQFYKEILAEQNKILMMSEN